MRRGLTLIEVLVAMFLIMVAAGTLLAAATLASKGGEFSREEALGQLLAASIVEDVEAHQFGSSRPFPGWTDNSGTWERKVSFRAFEGGLPVENNFYLKVRKADKGNGSFFGRGSENYDKVHLEVSWRTTDKDHHLEGEVEVTR